MLKDLIQKNRSYRRFFQEKRIEKEKLVELVGLVRWCASARNAQALKYVVIEKEEICEKIFPCLKWAGYLKEWDGPEEGERPAAYLIQVLDTHIEENCLCDDGLQLQTILLGAAEEGMGGCIIKAFQAEALRKELNLPEYLKILYVLALGVPKEKVVIEDIQEGDYKYWRDAEGTHHVPKRKAEELLVSQGVMLER